MSTPMYDKIQKMTVALLTAFILLLCQCFSALASSVDSVQVRSAPLSTDSITKNGMVRVYLSSLGNPASLDLTVNGNYSLSHNGEFIPSGSKLKVNFSAPTGQLTLAFQGQTIQMGKSFSLRRHSAAGSNGILIAQARNPQNPYPGDLSFEAVNNGGSYTLYTIAHIYIENYLYGVLPYEMGNSSGIEALKAQAVAARTYTVRMMELRASQRYDVKDTTSDQVYRGTPSGNANCVSAVDATRGIVLMYGSDYITTYYSASNGGQTETARNATAYAYMKVKDDPFDYANPSSTVKKKTVYADLTSPSNPSGLITLLKGKAVSSLQRSGYPATQANTTLQTLKSVTPHTPMYGSPSRLYTKMDFTFTVSTQNASGQTAIVTLTETCGIFTELEGMLGMSIQSLQNELWSVEKGNGTFVLQARRYGHGMGMSQRGAMYMAKLGYSYDQILGFYYEGCKRVKHSFTNTILNASTGDQQITVEPPAELEQSQLGACVGTVTLNGSGGTLAIRAEASSGAPLVGTAGNGALVEVLIQTGSWYQVRFGEIVGYVPSSALSITGTPENQQHQVSSVLGFATVKANDFVNLRESASMSAKILGTAPSGAVLTVFGQSGSWARVQYQALVAYVNTNYISAITSGYPSSDLNSGSKKAMVVTETGTGTVNLRQSASTSAKLVDRLAVGTIVTVLSDDGSWCRIVSEAGEGYMLSEFLKYVDDTQDAPPEEEENEAQVPENEQPETEEPEEETTESAASYAVVNTEYGSLNMRAESRAGSRILTTIPKGAQVVLLARGDVWSAVRYGGYEGFVMSCYLAFPSDSTSNDASGPETGGSCTAVVVTPSGTLNLRALPRTGSQILDRIPPNTVLNVLERGAEWSMVEYLGTRGYVMSVFLSFNPAAQSPAETPPEENKVPSSLQTAYVNTQSGSLNLRRQPGLDSGVLTTIPRNALVTVTAYGDQWCSVRYGAYEGYVMTGYLRFEDQSAGAPGESAKPEEVPQMPETAKTPAYVNTPSGALNLRSEANGNAQIVTTIPQYAQVWLLEQGTEWSKITYGDTTGFVMTRFLSDEKPASPDEGTSASPPSETSPEASEKPREPYATVGGMVLDVTLEAPSTAMYALAKNDTQLYAMCSENAEVHLMVPAGEEVEILLLGELWCRVAYQNEQGYCPRSYLDVRSDP